MRRKILAGILAFAMTVGSFSPMMSSSEVKAAANAPVAASYDEASGKVVIGNDYISREFSTANGKVSTVNITNKRTGSTPTVFTPAEGSEEFIVRLTKENAQHPALDREGWKAEANSYQNEKGDADGNAPNLLDGNLSSIWHTNYGGGTGSQTYAEGYHVLFDLNGAKNFKCFSYTPRQEGEDINGNIKGYELYVSNAETKPAADDESAWTRISAGDFRYDGTNPIYVNVGEQTAKYLKFVPTSAKNGKAFAGGAEFNLHAEEYTKTPDEGRTFAASALTLKDGAEGVSITPTTATINGKEKTGKMIRFSFQPYQFKNITWTIDEVIVMYDGDHFMRKFMEISVPENQKEQAVIDYIDLESMKVNENDATWTIPRGRGGIVEMDEFKANLGQPIYIQGMFFGSEFPVSQNEILEGIGFMRYYTGKSFARLEKDNQLTKDDKYVTWQTVAGAARSTENEVIQADFFEYIQSIATPSDFRIQYNSWFDNMMFIDDDNILESFIEVDKELAGTGVRPLDSYVVDDGWNNYNRTPQAAGTERARRSGTTVNTDGFWTFNNKFPEKLTPSSELVHNFGSNFGVWIGPRGGYNYYGDLAEILVQSDNGSRAGGSIDVADRKYVAKYQEMAIQWQHDYDVNYWKWDGFADRSQYNHFASADGVPGYANRHMTGGYQGMYHVTDLWEAWIDLMEAVRKDAEEQKIPKLWISITCYVNPSPWYLQWANSVWLQCTHDQNDAGSSASKMDRQITYRDAAYYDFLKNHQFQFPLQNIYNHDPVYGKEGTGMNVGTATDEQFQNYLYMLATRGTAFWELYYSDSIMTPGKYEVTAEFLAWAEENFHMLKNAKMFGGSPNTGTVLGGSSNGVNNTYGFACFDGTDGILSMRNPATTAKELTFTFDRTLGVPENAGTLQYHMEHTHNLTEGTKTTGELKYGQKVTVTLQPDEVRILRISKNGDTTAPEIVNVMTDGDKTIKVQFNEKVKGETFKVEGAEVASVEQSADDLTYRLTLTERPQNGTVLTVKGAGITDLAGNAASEETMSVKFYEDNCLLLTEEKTGVNGAETLADAAKLTGHNGFTAAVKVKTTAADKVLLKQENGYTIGITAEGKAYAELNGAKVESTVTVNDDAAHTIVAVKEANGILKIYIDGELDKSVYKEANKTYEVAEGAVTLGAEGFTGDLQAAVYDRGFGYDEVANVFAPAEPSEPQEKIELTADMITVSGTSEMNSNNTTTFEAASVIDGDNTTYWTSQQVDAGISTKDAWMQINLGKDYKLTKVDFTKRYNTASADKPLECTGNLEGYVLEGKSEGGDWRVIKEAAIPNTGKEATTNIVFDQEETVQYLRLTGTGSYHWQEQNKNKFMTVADIAVFGEEAKAPATNLALNKPAIARWTANGEDAENNKTGNDPRPISMAVDGTKDNSNNYGEFGADARNESSYMQVDLEQLCEIDSVNLYRYYADTRTYRGTVIAVSKTADFAEPTIIYNSDKEGENGFHGLGVGEDDTYAESSSGLTVTLDAPVEGQYVRVYMHGKDGATNVGNTNHIVELEVMGRAAAVQPVTNVRLSVEANNAEGGTVAITDAEGTETSVALGTIASVTAAANEGYELVDWEVNGESVGHHRSPFAFNVTKDTTVTAIFAPKLCTLTVNVTPEGSGSVQVEATPAPAEGLADNTYARGTELTLTAVPAEGYRFVKWTEDGKADVATEVYSFTLSENRTVTAVFEEIPKYEVTVTVAEDSKEMGTAEIADAAADNRYYAGTELTLRAQANEGYIFKGWSVGEDSAIVSDQNPYTYTVAESAAVLKAHFEAIETPEAAYSVTVSSADETMGTAAVVTEANAEEGKFTAGTSVTVKAEANDGYEFVSWTENDGVVSETAEFTFEIAADRVLKANFRRAEISAEEIWNSVKDQIPSKITKDQTSLTLPEVPEGYTIVIESASPEGIIGTDNSVTIPEDETAVTVTFKVTGPSAENVFSGTKEITVEGKQELPPTAQEVLNGLKPQDKIEKGENFVLPTVPEGFKVEISAVNPEGVIGLDGTVTTPEKDKAVIVTLKVTGPDGKDMAEGDFVVTVIGKNETKPPVNPPVDPEGPSNPENPQGTPGTPGTPQTPGTPSTPNTPSTPSTPNSSGAPAKTADSSQTVLWAGVLALACAAFIIFDKKKKQA